MPDIVKILAERCNSETNLAEVKKIDYAYHGRSIGYFVIKSHVETEKYNKIAPKIAEKMLQIFNDKIKHILPFPIEPIQLDYTNTLYLYVDERRTEQFYRTIIYFDIKKLTADDPNFESRWIQYILDRGSSFVKPLHTLDPEKVTLDIPDDVINLLIKVITKPDAKVSDALYYSKFSTLGSVMYQRKTLGVLFDPIQLFYVLNFININYDTIRLKLLKSMIGG